MILWLLSNTIIFVSSNNTIRNHSALLRIALNYEPSIVFCVGFHTLSVRLIGKNVVFSKANFDRHSQAVL